ncbi:MAG: class II aldolase/adducin family protein, partial [Bacteroidales bacterium]|nr:class II aldolase/adducin family protein [Bacteroidales bacterium]
PGEMVCVAPDGAYEGPLKPSMEYPLHRAVYDARPDIRALIHAHPPVLTAFSIVHRTPETSLLNSWREICGTVGYAGYATPGSMEMGENVASEFRKGHDAVIMENHAAVAGGKDLAEALARLEALEYCARTVHAAPVIGEIRVPYSVQNNTSEFPEGNQLPLSGQDQHPGENGCVMTHEEELLAEDICRIASRACNRGLMYGFCGTVSARSEGDSFLITRERVLRYEIGKTGITRAGITGTGFHTWLHEEIYRRFPSVNAVITASPVYLMAFAVTGKGIDVRTIPESWLLLKELPYLNAAALSPGQEEIFEILKSGTPAVLLANDAVLVTGDNLLCHLYSQSKSVRSSQSQKSRSKHSGRNS